MRICESHCMKSSELTTINTPFWFFRYKSLPFGLNVSLAVLQVINEIITGSDGVQSYQDDIVVHAENVKSHMEHLLKLLRRLFGCKFTRVSLNLFLSSS